MTIKQYIISFAAAALTAVLLTGCSGDSASDISPDPTPSTGKSEIKVNADIRQMLEGTRATLVNSNGDLQTYDLKIDAYYNGTDDAFLSGVKLHHTGSTPAWQFWDGSAQLHYYWPFEGSTVAGGSTVASTLDFVGFCPFEKPEYIGTPTYAHCHRSKLHLRHEQLYDSCVSKLNAGIPGICTAQPDSCHTDNSRIRCSANGIQAPLCPHQVYHYCCQWHTCSDKQHQH